MNSIWFVETKIAGQYIPHTAERSRDDARALQKYLKAIRQIGVPSRIRRYTPDNISRG
jgi:hypothetical protein